MTTLSDFSLYGSFQPTVEYPEDNCCILYQHTSFGGEQEKICHDGPGTNKNVRLDTTLDFNNRTSSFQCGKNTWFNFIKDKNHHEEDDVLVWGRVMSGAGHLKNYDVNQGGWSDTISRVQLGYYDALTMGAVNVYDSTGCDGPGARLYYNPDDIDGGQWNLSDIKKLGLNNNTASSIQVPEGYTAYLYGWNGFQNLKKTIVGEYVDWETQELQCINLTDMNDTLGSVVVKRTSPAVGYWQAITSTESQEYTLHVGINYAQSTATS